MSGILEELLVRFCAPTLAGIKTAGLFTAFYDSLPSFLSELRDLNRFLTGDGLCVIPLRLSSGRALLYLYRPDRLRRDLAESRTEQLLCRFGYPRCSPAGRLACLRQRLSAETGFPHEIGLFLGYPPEDVEGFIRHRALDYKVCGCWKVYGDAEKACREFDRYRVCTDRCCRLWEQGVGLEGILARKALIA